MFSDLNWGFNLSFSGTCEVQQLPSVYWSFVYCWGWSSSTLATWCEELTHWKRPWCWERWKAGGEGDERMRWLDGIADFIGHEFEQALGVGDGQGSLACFSPWGWKELDMIEWLSWTVYCPHEVPRPGLARFSIGLISFFYLIWKFSLSIMDMSLYIITYVYVIHVCAL